MALGYWVLPTLVTLAVIVWWVWHSRPDPTHNVGRAFAVLLGLGAGVIVILLAWLAYFASRVLFGIGA